MARRAADGDEQKNRPADWHAQSAEAVLVALGSSQDGLDDHEAAERLRQCGPNRLPEARRRGPLLRFLAQFRNVLIYVLLASAAITAALGHFVDTGVILAVVIINALVGFIQEGRAERAMDSIRRMLAPRAAVLRGGERRGIPGEDVVPGDIVLLEAGDRAPADLRLLKVRGLQIQEAILTGESMAVGKSTGPVPAGAPLGDRTSMAFSGTMVTAGQGRGVVVATGVNTEIGRISGMLSRVEKMTTPLLRKMNAFARWLTLLILGVAALLLLYGSLVAGYEFAEMFMVVVSLSVAAIPEGLPAVLTITLAVGVQAMARRNAIVRRLPAIETLGSVSVICTDKTGTLTRNEMMVVTVVTRDHDFTVRGEGYEPEGDILLGGRAVEGEDCPDLAELALAGALCNSASLRRKDGAWTVEGDPMEGALLALARKAGLDEEAARATWARTDVVPFDSRRHFMAGLHHNHEGRAFIFVKGAPERVLQMCRDQRAGAGSSEPVDKARWRETAERIADQGQRILALAARAVDPAHTVLETHDVEGKLTLLGLVGITDPPRPESADSVAVCKRAGIRVKMITGDYAGTAAAIARQIRLENPDNVLTGADLDAMSDGQLADVVLNTDVFARTSPEHKLRLVEALQSHGLIVAMTGDGVNDAPALKRADAAIAMGVTGSEAAKEAAEIVLADDNFATIAAAVREGRTVYDNIRKVISWTLPTNAGETTTIIAALLFGMALPVTPIQILWINLITAVTLGLALAFEPTEENTMRRPPRRPGEPLLTGQLAWHIVLVSVLFLGGVFSIFSHALERGHSLELARTIAMNTLVVMEVFHLFFVRNIYGTSLTWKAVRGTRVVWATVIVVILAQFAVTYLPPLQNVFATRSVPLYDGVLIVLAGMALFAVIETEKQVRLRLSRGRPSGESAQRPL